MIKTLEFLSAVVNLWDCINKFAELDYKMLQVPTQISKRTVSEPFKRGMDPIGNSQLNKEYQFVRPIPGYQEFKKILDENRAVDLLKVGYQRFSLTLPSSLSHEFGGDNLSMTKERVSQIFLVPYFIHHWMRTKKVCRVTDSKKVQKFNGQFGGFDLSFLPYDAFILELDKPLRYRDHESISERSVDYNLQHFLVHRDGGLIHVMGIPNELETSLTAEDNRTITEMLQEIAGFEERAKEIKSMKPKHAIKRATKLNARVEEFFGKAERTYPIKSRIIYSGMAVFSSSFNEDGTIANIGISDYLMDPKREGEFSLSEVVCALAEILSGFSRTLMATQAVYQTISENSAGEGGNVSAAGSSAVVLSNEGPDLTWYQVKQDSVDHLKAYSSKGKVQASYVEGAHKSPHARRGHTRSYRDDQGTVIKTVQVKRSYINKGLLEKKTPKGSTLTA